MTAKCCVLIGASLLLLASGIGFCCVGARPLAMGGAFIGLADDANATYWNPAGIARFQGNKATAMYTATNRDNINYLGYAAYAGRLAGRNAGYGFSYVSHRLDLGGYGTDDQTWLWLSGAFRANADTTVGLNVRFTNDSISGLSTEAGLDVAILRVVDEKWSVGLLIQNINEPNIKDGATTVAVNARNIRPGIAYHYDERTVITADIYDMFDHSGAMALRVGGERVLPSGLAVRAGYYGAGSCTGVTLGLGGRMGRVQVDGALMTGDLDNTVLFSASGTY